MKEHLAKALRENEILLKAVYLNYTYYINILEDAYGC